jgi:hypothetical protein
MYNCIMKYYSALNLQREEDLSNAAHSWGIMLKEIQQKDTLYNSIYTKYVSKAARFIETK